MFLIALVAMTMLGTSAAGYYIDTSVVHPPLQLFGICEPPATLQTVGATYGVGGHTACLTSTLRNQSINGQNQQVVVQEPAGYYEYLNGSRAAP